MHTYGSTRGDAFMDYYKMILLHVWSCISQLMQDWEQVSSQARKSLKPCKKSLWQ